MKLKLEPLNLNKINGDDIPNNTIFYGKFYGKSYSSYEHLRLWIKFQPFLYDKPAVFSLTETSDGTKALSWDNCGALIFSDYEPYKIIVK
jgi:hypothetical protein